jgi:hypothetical protein
MPIDLGDQVTRSVDLTNSSGVAVDADSTPTYSVTLPGGTAGIAPAVQHGGTGEYYVVYPTTVPGPHNDRFSAVVGGVTIVIPDSFTVEDSSPSLVSVAEALGHLRATNTITDPADLEELRGLCLAATDAVERDLGLVLVRRTFSDTFDGGRTELSLRRMPPRPADGGTLTVTSLTENGTTLTEGSGFVVRRNRWTLARGTTVSRQCWAGGIENIAVTYTASCNPAPRVARDVCLNAIQRLWQSTQQMPHPYLDEVSADAAVFSAAASLTAVQMGAYKSLAPVLAG